MPEEATQAPADEEVQDTPQPTDEIRDDQDTSADTEDTTEETSDVDWRKRYEDLQPEYTRASQEAAQYRQVVELAREGDPEALEWLGYETEDADTEDEDDDPEDRIERLEQTVAQQHEEAEAVAFEEAENKWLKQTFSELEKKESVKLTDAERRAVQADATANRFEDGQPDIEGAYQRFEEAAKAYHERYIASKKAPKVGVGSAGTKKFNPNDTDERQNFMREVMESEGSDT